MGSIRMHNTCIMYCICFNWIEVVYRLYLLSFPNSPESKIIWIFLHLVKSDLTWITTLLFILFNSSIYRRWTHLIDIKKINWWFKAWITYFRIGCWRFMEKSFNSSKILFNKYLKNFRSSLRRNRNNIMYYEKWKQFVPYLCRLMQLELLAKRSTWVFRMPFLRFYKAWYSQ